MQGTRRPNNTNTKDMEPGDYSLQTWTKEPHWQVRDPGGDIGSLWDHEITVHEDETITVSPSILGTTGNKWHGYLERGVWREC